MNSTAFLAAAGAVLAMSVFVYLNYPKSWRENRMFRAVLILWHLFGMSAAAMIFTVFKEIPYMGIKYEIVRIGTYYYMMVLFLTILFGVRDLISFLIHFIKRKPVGTEQHWYTKREIQAILFITVSFLITTAGYFNIDFLHTTEYDIAVHKQSAEKNLNVLLIADIHAGSGNWDFLYLDLEDKINAAEPDVILLAGDIFDETTSERDVELVRRLFESIKEPRYGIFYIYGNHDDARDDWTGTKLREMGMTALGDRMTVLGSDIQLIGHDDPKVSHLTCEQLMASLDIDYDKPVLVLEHRPKEFSRLAELGGDLAVAGHTHGFNIPFFMGSPAFNDMYYGFRKYGDLNAVTTSGASVWGWHYRLPSRSEIVSLHLHFD